MGSHHLMAEHNTSAGYDDDDDADAAVVGTKVHAMLS